MLRILRNANRIKLCRFLLQYHSKDQASRQRKSRSSSNEVDDDRPIYGDATISITRLVSPKPSGCTGVHPVYLRILGSMIIIIPPFIIINIFYDIGSFCP